MHGIPIKFNDTKSTCLCQEYFPKWQRWSHFGGRIPTTICRYSPGGGAMSFASVRYRATALPQRNEPGVSHQCSSSLSHIGFHSAAHGREGLSATWEAFQNYVYICSRWTIWMWNSKKLFWRSSPYLKEFGGNTFNSSSGLVDNLSVDYDCFSWRVAGFWCCPRDLDGPGETAE